MTVRRGSRAVFALVVAVLIPAAAFAQGRPFGRLFLSVGQGYDDNLFAAPESGNQRSDFITRFGPVFEGGYNSPTTSLLGHYGFDAERYVELTELNKTLARQEARLDFTHRPRPRLGLLLDGSYLDTQTPRELNVATLLPAGRARAQRVRGHSGVIYDATAVMKVFADYEVANDQIAGSFVTTTQTSRLGASFRPTPRTTFRTDYRFAYLTFGDEETMYTVAATAGIARVLSPSLTLEIDAGPRLSLGEIKPEIAAQLRQKLRRGEVLVAYFATEDTLLGEVGTIQVQRLMGTWTHTPWRAVSLRVSPAAARSWRDGTPVSVYEVAGDVTFRTNSTLSFVVAGHMGRQNGNFSGVPDVIPYRGISIKTVVALQ